MTRVQIKSFLRRKDGSFLEFGDAVELETCMTHEVVTGWEASPILAGGRRDDA